MSLPPPPPPPYTTGSGGTPSSLNPIQRGHLGQHRLAAWPRRSVATAIDFAATIWAPSFIPRADVAEVVIVVLVLLNSVFLQARTYQSLGKMIMGISLGRPITFPGDGFNHWSKPTYLRCLIRVLWHFFDTIFFIGFLRPIWHFYYQTFADSITHTVVVVGQLPKDSYNQRGAQNVI